MTDPNTAVATQLRNIEIKTGKKLVDLNQIIAKSGLSKVSEQRAMLMETLGLGYGDANALALQRKKLQETPDDDPLVLIYTGAKAHLRHLHERLVHEIDLIGSSEKHAKKNYISFRRKKQFAMLGPVTNDMLELGLNIKGLPATPRLKAVAAGGMCQYTVRITSESEIDKELVGWIRQAYDGAG